MHSHQRSRGKVLFEVLCALSLAASFAGAWNQTGSSALQASAAIMALFAIYWSFGLVARDRRDEAAQPAAAVAAAQEATVETAVPEEVFIREPDVVTEPEPVAAEPKKRRARKAPKAAAVAAALVEPVEPEAIEQPVSSGPPLEQLFDVQPLVRQPRPAFGRKARGNRPLPAA
jgi:hypothetical protein